jgi:TPR repeat protein/type II secretory pathway predicted ATPase ExeA
MRAEGAWLPTLDFFNLTWSPFQANPTGPLVLETGPLRRAVAWIRTELQFGMPLVCLTGSRGIGKTSVALALPNLLQDRVACLLDVSQPWRELEVSIARQFSLANESLARDTLLGDRTDPRRVLVVDDAERLPDETLWKLREVLGFEDRGGHRLVRCIVLANPDRAEPGAAATHWMQAVQPRIKLDAMLTRELARYIEARLLNAGWEGGELFWPEAMRTIHRLSDGVPRIANRICDRALVAAANRETRLIRADMIEAVWEEVIASLRSASSPGMHASDPLGAARQALASQEEEALLLTELSPSRPSSRSGARAQARIATPQHEQRVGKKAPSAGPPSEPRSSEAEPDAAEAPAADDRSRRPWFRFDRTFGIEPADLKAALEQMLERVNRHRKVLAMGLVTVTGALVAAGLSIFPPAEHRVSDPATALSASDPEPSRSGQGDPVGNDLPRADAALAPSVEPPPPPVAPPDPEPAVPASAPMAHQPPQLAPASAARTGVVEPESAEPRAAAAEIPQPAVGEPAVIEPVPAPPRAPAPRTAARPPGPDAGETRRAGGAVPAAAAARATARVDPDAGAIELDAWPDDLEFTLEMHPATPAAPSPKLVLPEPEITRSLTGGGAGLFAGRGSDADASAEMWLRRAASQGHAEAELQLAILSEQGRGVAVDAASAARRYRRSAEQGDARAQRRLGMLYANGRGVPEDYEQAIQWLSRAAEQGDIGAQVELAVMYAKGVAGPDDISKAIKWFRKAAHGGDALAQAQLGIMYARGEGVDQDDAQAAAWFRKAAAQGNSLAQFNLGVMLNKNRTSSGGDNEPIHWYRLAAAQGNADAELTLGGLYAAGRGVEHDDAKAVDWFRKAANQGNPVAQFNLGVMLEQGRGVAKDGVEAVRWYRESAEQGYPPAQITLARLYARGLGVAEDDAAAALWYRRAAELGSADARYQLGLMLLAGEGVPQDAEIAVRWLTEAAFAGHAGAQLQLGVMYAQGNGVARDLAVALGWLRKAADSGEPRARGAAQAGRALRFGRSCACGREGRGLLAHAGGRAGRSGCAVPAGTHVRQGRGQRSRRGPGALLVWACRPKRGRRGTVQSGLHPLQR